MTRPILIVEDDPLQRQMLSTLLSRKLGFQSWTASNGREALDIMNSDKLCSIKIAIIDLNMPVMGGMETLEILHQKYPSVAVIMLTGSKDIEDAVQAIRAGATDFITKPYEGERMAITVKNALKIKALSNEVQRLKIEKEGKFGFENLIGHDAGILQEVTLARKAASSDIPVLITGETGTGKEVFARAIHGESQRAGFPFVAVNCGAIPLQLVESTLFGHEKGSFTGAIDKFVGKFREAEGGTIFLDEVGELPLDTQVKLLRVLQQKEVEPVGSSKTIPVNVRIISATNRNLEVEVKEKKFREDLYFRLNVFKVTLPPLRERKEDISALARCFIERACVSENRLLKELSQTSEKYLNSQMWPGNVRQLENVIRRAVVMCDDNIIEINDLTSEKLSRSSFIECTENQDGYNRHNISMINADGSFKTLEEIEQETIEIALHHSEGNVTQAAKLLNIAKSTFYKKIKNVIPE